MKKIFPPLFLILFLALLLNLQCKQVPSAQLPDVRVKDLNGNEMSLTQFQGKPVIVNFWATWCGPCRIEIPMLNEIHRKYASRGLVIVGISTDDDGATSVKPFLKDVPIEYLTVVAGADTEEKFGGILGLPSNFFYDKSGKQIAKAIGLQPREFFEEKISDMLSSQ